MSNENKPDLSDLKARLGLKKPAAKSTGGASSSSSATKSGAQATIPRPDKPTATGSGARAALKAAQLGESSDTSGGSSPASGQSSAAAAQPVRAAAQPAAKPAPRPGPPAGAMGPPPTARRRDSPADDGGADLAAVANEKVDLKDLGIEEDVGLGLPAPIMALMGILLVMGLFFGFMAAQTMQVRDLENRRIGDAQRVQDYLEPRLVALTEAVEIIEGLDPLNPDYDAVRRLSQLEMAIGAEALPNNRILLGRQIVGPLHQLSAQSNLLQERVREHHALTARVDRAEIEALKAHQAEQTSEEGQLALALNLGQYAGFQQNPTEFRPPTGRLVMVTDPEQDEEGMIEIKVLYREGERQRVTPISVLMINEGDLLLSDGENALKRYERRVRALKSQVDTITRRIEPLRQAVAEVASQEGPGLLALTGSTEEYDETTPAEPAEE